MFQLVTQPTRFRLGAEPHILDLILSNEEAMVHNIKYTTGLGNSDHIMYFVSVGLYIELYIAMLDIIITRLI